MFVSLFNYISKIDGLQLHLIDTSHLEFNRYKLLSQLRQKEVAYFHTIKHKARQHEWLAVRHALIQQLGDLGASLAKDDCGKPYFPSRPDLELSISHSAGIVAILLGDRPLGLDIQELTPKVPLLKHKFMTPVEQSFLGEHSELQQHFCWSTKEALYKAYAKRKLDFRGHIFTQPFEDLSGISKGFIRKDNFERWYDIEFTYDDELQMVLACAAECQ